MPNLKELAEVAENSELLSRFKIAVKRAAYVALADVAATQPLKDWAKRVIGDAGQPGRADWYASRTLEGCLVDNAAFRAAIDASLLANAPVSMTDTQFVLLVDTWVSRFAAQNI